MAFLKAFVCQVVLLGIYKLFLEQIFEDYLVPDDLSRNFLVGFVCLLCFGIQLYTDKAADEDNAEAEEDLKAKSNLREVANTKIFASPEISVLQEIVTETVGSNASSRGKGSRTQIASQDVSSKYQQVTDSEKRSNVISPTETEKIAKMSHSGIFAEFSTNASDAIPNATKSNGIGNPEVAASTVHTSHEQETTTIPVLNGISETNICEESDEDGIEIDQLETKELVKEAESLVTTQAEEIEAFNPEPVANITAVSECMLSNGENISIAQDLEEITTLKTDESETEVINCTIEELSNNIDKISSNIIEEIESKKSVNDEIGDKQESTLVSQPDGCVKDVTESLPSTHEVNNTISAPTKAVNASETTNKNNAETSTLGNTTIPSTRQKIKASGEVCVAPLTIDISFIYACH